jgi:hypothetical protein
MTAFMHDVARAALPVAIALLVLAATARAAMAGIDDERARRLAAQYLEPLSTWCLVALATHTVALGLAGEAGALSVALPLALGAAAVVLLVSGEPAERPAPAPAADTAATSVASALSTPAPGGRLWADPVDDESARRSGLWSNA